MYITIILHCYPVSLCLGDDSLFASMTLFCQPGYIARADKRKRLHMLPVFVSQFDLFSN